MLRKKTKYFFMSHEKNEREKHNFEQIIHPLAF